MGRVVRETWEIDEVPGLYDDQVPGQYTYVYDHDFAGKLTGITYPAGFFVDYDYHDGSGLLESVIDSDNRWFAEFPVYSPSGKPTEVLYGSGTETTYTYDEATHRLTRIRTENPSLPLLQDREYEYYRTGDVKKIILHNISSAEFDYVYDDLHRLRSVVSESWGAIRYTYDAIGNILSREVDNKYSVPEKYDFFDYRCDSPRPHAISGVYLNGAYHGFEYDAAGNIVYGPGLSNPAAPTQRYVNYTNFNRPKEIYTLSNGRTRKTSLVYDAEDRRILKSIHNMNAEYHPADSDARSPEYTDDPPEPEDDPISMRVVEPGFMFESATCYLGDYLEKTTRDGVNWEDVKYIFAAGQRIAKIDSDGVHYFHKDHLGSTNVVTNEVTDEIGLDYMELAQHMPYGALWGYHLGDNWEPTKYKFTDQELDSESGLYNYGARLYDPALGRFISPDSILPDVYDPQQLNRYAYTRNNPLIYIDPSGNTTEHYDETMSTLGTEWGLEPREPQIKSPKLKETIPNEIGTFFHKLVNPSEWGLDQGVKNFMTICDIALTFVGGNYGKKALDKVSKKTISGTKTDDFIEKAKKFLGDDSEIVKPDDGSDLILRSKDRTKQIRFDISDPHGLDPHVNIEKFKPRDKYPGDKRFIRTEDLHIFPEKN